MYKLSIFLCFSIWKQIYTSLSNSKNSRNNQFQWLVCKIFFFYKSNINKTEWLVWKVQNKVIIKFVDCPFYLLFILALVLTHTHKQNRLSRITFSFLFEYAVFLPFKCFSVIELSFYHQFHSYLEIAEFLNFHWYRAIIYFDYQYRAMQYDLSSIIWLIDVWLF